MQSRRPTTLHHLIVSLHIRRDEDDLRAKPRPCIFEQLHRIWTPASLLRVPKNHALRLNVLLDQASDGRPKGALLVGADPDKEPVWALDAGRESGADAGARADADAALEHGGGVADASWRVLERCFDHD